MPPLYRDDGRHALHWLSEEIYHRFIDEGYLRRTRSRDAIQREMDKIEGSLLSEFALAANVRSSLKRLGLVTVRYAGLDDEPSSVTFRTLCAPAQSRLSRCADCGTQAVGFHEAALRDYP